MDALNEMGERADHIIEWLEACYLEYAKAHPGSTHGRLAVDMGNLIRRLAIVEVLLESVLGLPGALKYRGLDGEATG